VSTTALRLRRLEAVFVPRLRAFSESPEMLAIRKMLPWSFGGLAAGLLFFMLFDASGTLLERFTASFAAAFGVMSAVLVVLLAADLAPRRHVPAVLAVAVAVAAFALSLPYTHGGTVPALAKALGSSGLFLAIGLGLLSVDLPAALRPRLGRAGGFVAGTVLAIGGAALLRFLGISLTAELDLIIAPLGSLGDSLTALLIITLVETLLWTIGIHGPALLAAVVLPVYINLQLQNTEAFRHHLVLPHIVTVSTFLFVFPGGAGATLPLVLFLLASKLRRERTVAYATVVPSVFNANEPLMFGLPVVLNPYLSVPFVLAPLVLALVTWEAMNVGFVARPAFYIPSTIPLPFSVFLATKDWRSVVLIAVNLGLAAAIYWPFVRHREAEALAEEAALEGGTPGAVAGA
jgi:PTS system cellobiose-specific IIC component